MHPSDELFSNGQINVSALPEADRMDMIPLEPVYKTVRYISSAMSGMIFVFIGWLTVWIEPRLGLYGYIGAGLITLLAGWMLYYTGMVYHYMGYAVREKDISFKSGWLWKSMTTVPFNRVQHCDIKQGILDRRFGISRLSIYTAGGQSTDLVIPGLLPDTAEKLKTFILKATEQAIENE